MCPGQAARQVRPRVTRSSRRASIFLTPTDTFLSGRAPPPVDVLEPEGWAHDEGGEIAEGKPRSKGDCAFFKHSRELQAQDVLRTRVEGGGAHIGFAAESYDVEKHGETFKSIARVSLYDGMTIIKSDISRDRGNLKDYIPKTLPYDVALRINKDGIVPQIQFNDDGV